MRYKTYLILFSILLLDSQAVLGQEQRYRVELLVLRHLEADSPGEPVPALRDFSAALDLLAPSAESPLPAPAESSQVPAVAQPGVHVVEQPQAPVVLQETPGEVMQQAWRRLHSANGLRPELYLSWEQAASAGSPEIRIHDNELVFEQDPYASLQDASVFQPAGDARVQVNGGATVMERPAGDVASGETTPADMVPGLVQYFRLDGTARLRVSRFLHLDLDIELREPAAETAQSGAMQQKPGPQDTAQPGSAGPSAKTYTVHAIRQSRQLQLQNLQYFDGPLVAVLALVSRVEPLPQDAQ